MKRRTTPTSTGSRSLSASREQRESVLTRQGGRTWHSSELALRVFACARGRTRGFHAVCVEKGMRGAGRARLGVCECVVRVVFGARRAAVTSLRAPRASPLAERGRLQERCAPARRAHPLSAPSTPRGLRGGRLATPTRWVDAVGYSYKGSRYSFYDLWKIILWIAFCYAEWRIRLRTLYRPAFVFFPALSIPLF